MLFNATNHMGTKEAASGALAVAFTPNPQPQPWPYNVRPALTLRGTS